MSLPEKPHSGVVTEGEARELRSLLTAEDARWLIANLPTFHADDHKRVRAAEVTTVLRKLASAVPVEREHEVSVPEFERIAVGLIEATDLLRETINGYKVDEAAQWLLARGFLADDEPDIGTLAGLLEAIQGDALREHEVTPASYDPQAAMMAVLRAYGRVRDGQWVKGAATHVFAELLTELQKAGWTLTRGGEHEVTDAERPTAMLAEFHAALTDEPGRGNAALRLTLHEEEHEELLDELSWKRLGIDVREPKADEDVDRAKLARELADVVYISYGTAHAFAINLDAALEEIHRAAMSKLDPATMVVREDGKIMKPPGFVRPDMTAAVAAARGTSTDQPSEALKEEFRMSTSGGMAFPICGREQATERRVVSDWEPFSATDQGSDER